MNGASLNDFPLPTAPALSGLPAEKPILFVSVRELASLVCAGGDLGGGSFSGPNRALEGTRGHQRVQKSRPPGYETEVFLRHEVDALDVALRIAGRIDGVSRTVYGIKLEEIKTLARAWNQKANPEHWAQLKVYGFIYAQQHGLAELELQLTYLELQSNRLHELTELWRFESLRAFFDRTVAVYIEWMRKELRWRGQRDSSLTALPFPHRLLRPGQGALMQEVEFAITHGSKLFAEAPTGIGKTVSALYPALRALGHGQVGKIFYLTSKGSGRAIAEKALADARSGGARVRSLSLTAREKICFGEQKPCDTASCPYAKGYYDRSRRALEELLEREAMTRPVIEEVARKHTVCPFELSLEAAHWADVIICDYNYVFDPGAYLRSLFEEDGNEFLFLIDEAHNLVDRSREMFSAEITAGELEALRAFAEDTSPQCAAALRSAAIEAHALGEEHLGEERVECALAEAPGNLVTMLQGVVGSAEEWLALNKQTEYRLALTDLYFRALAFVRISEGFNDRYATIVRRERGTTLVRLFCVDASQMLASALARGRAAVFFSATLSPLEYFRTTLGGAETDRMLSLNSPFPQERMGVLVNSTIRTDFKNRGRSYEDVALGIGQLAEARSGRYIAFFPSHDYLQQTLARFKALFPSLEAVVQRRTMNDAEREEFLDKFDLPQPPINGLLLNDEPARARVGFAVMGGVFGEGIDLVGERLIGAIIVGVGLPQVCLERNLIKNYFDERGGSGFSHAYVYPGMNKVVQAAGRVIRSEEDRGVAMLIDARFAQRPYRDLLPPWWQPQLCNKENTRPLAQSFWAGAPGGELSEALLE